MPVTQFKSGQIGSVQRNDLDTTTAGEAVIRKLIAGTGTTITSTGVDAGTGDVTVTATPNAIAVASTAAQSLTAATRTYLVGSGVTLATAALKVGMRFEWTITLTKTAAGVAASAYDIAIGTLGTTGDAARVSFTKPAGTAVADEAKVTIVCVIRSIGASGVAVGNFHLAHNLAATGHALVPNVVLTTVSAAFDTTTATKIGICATTGAADAITVQLVTARAVGI